MGTLVAPEGEDPARAAPWGPILGLDGRLSTCCSRETHRNFEDFAWHELGRKTIAMTTQTRASSTFPSAAASAEARVRRDPHDGRPDSQNFARELARALERGRVDTLERSPIANVKGLCSGGVCGGSEGGSAPGDAASPGGRRVLESFCFAEQIGRGGGSFLASPEGSPEHAPAAAPDGLAALLAQPVADPGSLVEAGTGAGHAAREVVRAITGWLERRALDLVASRRSATLRVAPPSLGPVCLHLSLEDDGRLAVTVNASLEAARAILSEREALAAELRSRGLELGAFLPPGR